MSALTPLLIRTFGRTGSTMLMQILGSHEHICFERQYPFEHRYLTYAFNMARVAGSPSEKRAEWTNGVLFNNNTWFVGPMPYSKKQCIDRASLSRRLLTSNWQAFSDTIREHHDLASNTPAFYAEKAPEKVADTAHAELGARSIYLLRDPRDEMVSVKSFNKKRGFQGFGWLAADTDASYAQRMSQNRKPFMRKLMSMKTDEQHIAVRYEDLVQQPREEVARLSEWLGLTLDAGAGSGDRKIDKLHRTSSDAQSSVGRWRQELTPEVQCIFCDTLSGELKALGYPT